MWWRSARCDNCKKTGVLRKSHHVCQQCSRVSLDRDAFESLCRGQVVEINGLMITLQGIGFDAMTNAIWAAKIEVRAEDVGIGRAIREYVQGEDDV